MGSGSLAPTELRRGLATTQGTLPGLKLAVNQGSLAGEASDPPCYRFLLLDFLLVPLL